jgi:hypothetical protein
MAIDPSGDFHLVWADTMPGNGEIYYKKSTDGGATWSISRRLTQTWGGSADPEICADSSGNLHLVWADSTPGNSEIYYLRSTDGGTTWGSAKRLTWTSGLSGIPNIAVDPSGNPHVVWHDDTSGNKEIIYRKSPDGGGAWTAAQRLTWTMDDSGWPDIAADSSGNLHVVWGESMPANAEIYYRRFND